METKIVKIKWNNTERDVEIKRLTFGEKNDIQDQAIKTKVIGNSAQATLSQKILKEVSLLKGIKVAPFDVSIGAIQNLPADIGDYLFDEINKYNTISPEKKPELGGPSDKEQQTPE